MRLLSAMILVVMGVSGSGKSTIGQRLAEELGWPFEDGDAYHPTSNKEKMSCGIPLNDEDRYQWLLNLHQIIEGWHKSEQHGILVSSALKFKYRWVLLCGTRACYHDNTPGSTLSSSDEENTGISTPGSKVFKDTNSSASDRTTNTTQGQVKDQSGTKTELDQTNKTKPLADEQNPHDHVKYGGSHVDMPSWTQAASDRPRESEGKKSAPSPETNANVLFVHLKGTFEQISLRLSQRKGHFMNPGLLQSQFSTLEELRAEENGIVIDIEQGVESVVSDIVAEITPMIS